MTIQNNIVLMRLSVMYNRPDISADKPPPHTVDYVYAVNFPASESVADVAKFVEQFVTIFCLKGDISASGIRAGFDDVSGVWIIGFTLATRTKILLPVIQNLGKIVELAYNNCGNLTMLKSDKE